MLSKNMWSIYRKWLIIAIMSGCMMVLNQYEPVKARAFAPCYEECDSNVNLCRDECEEECDEGSTNSTCGTCIIACQNQWLNCMSVAVSCQGETVMPGQCGVTFGKYCEQDQYGWASCSTNPSTNYNHYSTECTILNHQCVNCPAGNGYTCENPNHLPPCP